MSLFAHRTSPHELAAFAGWTRREVERFRRAADFVEYEPGESITFQGSRAKEFIVLLTGAAEVRVDGLRTGAFVPGDHVGHEVLQAGRPAAATIRATHLCTAWVLSPTAFFELVERQPSFRQLVTATVDITDGVSVKRGISAGVRQAPLAY